MIWVVRRLLIPFAMGSVVSTMLLVIWIAWRTDTEAGLALNDLAFAALLVLPFQAVGLALLVPIALLLGDLALPRPVFPAILAAVGAALGNGLTGTRGRGMEVALPSPRY